MAGISLRRNDRVNPIGYSQDVMRIPLAESSFESLRDADLIYVDKTDLIASLASFREPVFLSRPRRFGKSLLVSTLESLFAHGLSYFQDLKLVSLWHETATYPVLHIDFSLTGTDAESFNEKLVTCLRIACQSQGLSYDENATSADMLLLSITSRCPPKSLILLIDEYDFPLISNLQDAKSFAMIEKTLKSFYAQVKGMGNVFRFVFITGTARFSHTSIFSEFNTLHDISYSDVYASLLGFTEEELESYFGPQLEDFAKRTRQSKEGVRERLRAYYDGYAFGPGENQRVYNPWSLMSALKHGTEREPYRPWWSNTGGFSALLHNWLKTDKHLVQACMALDKARSGESVASVTLEDLTAVAELGELEFPVTMFIAGYLTFKGKLGKQYLLNYPNLEVREYIADLLLKMLSNRLSLADDSADLTTEARKFKVQEALVSGDPLKVRAVLSSCLALYPYAERSALTTEAVVCALLAMALKSQGLNIVYAEHEFIGGRTDLEIPIVKSLMYPEGVTVVLEVKVARYSDAKQASDRIGRALEEAKEQIVTRRYARVAPPGSRALCYAVCVDFNTRDVEAVSYVKEEALSAGA